jgi:hypothetical protein
MSITLPENNNNINIKSYILDPLSVIIKLAILSNKPIGTKILIQNNVIYFQEPGMFQALCRYVLKTNKTDLQYMYNPIQVACGYFLSQGFVKGTPRIKSLFQCAQLGIEKLKETYKNCSMICLCLNYYYTIITNHLDEIYSETIFRRDSLSMLYIKEMTDALNNQWSTEKTTIILDIISFLINDKMATNNVKSLENIMDHIDLETRQTIQQIIQL